MHAPWTHPDSLCDYLNKAGLMYGLTKTFWHFKGEVDIFVELCPTILTSRTTHFANLSFNHFQYALCGLGGLWYRRIFNLGLLLMTHEEMISYAYNPIPLMPAYRIVVPWPRAGRVTGQQLKTSSEALLEGCCLKSMNAQYTARLQNDGRFTICRDLDQSIIWQSDVESDTGGALFYMVLETQGDLVIYNVNNRVIWSTKVMDKRTDGIYLEDDGVLRILSEGVVVWSMGP